MCSPLRSGITRYHYYYRVPPSSPHGLGTFQWLQSQARSSDSVTESSLYPLRIGHFKPFPGWGNVVDAAAVTWPCASTHHDLAGWRAMNAAWCLVSCRLAEMLRNSMYLLYLALVPGTLLMPTHHLQQTRLWSSENYGIA